MIPQISTDTWFMLAGWLVGAIVVVVGMRTQMNHLARELERLNRTLERAFSRIDENEKAINYLKGWTDAQKKFAPPGDNPT